jgi:pyruvate dehydrogenase E2 component (dihydrolipoamide acetyltransferase)
VRSSPAARRLARELGVEIARVTGTGSGGRITEKDVQAFHDSRAPVAATPLARRMAEEEGLDLTEIQGTGPGGRITEDDVLSVLEGGAGPPVARPGVVPFAGMRQAIAEGMLESLHSMAQLTLTTQADVTGLVELRDLLRQRWEARVSYTDLIVKAAAVALREHPILNSMLVGEEIVLHDEVNVGVAVALDEGLIVPVVRHADRKTVLEIHAEILDLARQAREGTLSVDQVTGGTFTVTNLGMYGVDAFTPIINPPQVAILGVGRITEGLALQGGQVVSRSKMALSLTIDHRVVDGAPGAAFLQTLVQLLEHPALIFAAGPVGTPD